MTLLLVVWALALMVLAVLLLLRSQKVCEVCCQVFSVSKLLLLLVIVE
jgi:hypothetical protein